ncbi:glycosyltransferase [Novosphingobium sp. BL-8H]|uniref:glycosyltransferase family 2 protein n=1 Tax=Novosphingobium sp. BL-8H TaxID=3127640 RepID=UPI003756DE80
MAPASIDVIIACHDAAGTIVRAIDSALASPHVRCVIVADDASNDGTPDLVERHYQGNAAVTVLRATRNAGPAQARNRAIEHVQAPWFAILDSDDFFLPGRFDAMPATGDFDLWADNILFTDRPDRLPPPAERRAVADAGETIDVARFLRGNLANFRQRRHQLGFCKPVFGTQFFRACGARYDERLRLGEDFVLVLGLLIAGARFRFTRHCGYVAIERSDSLSAAHTLADLEHLLTAEERLFRDYPQGGGAQKAFARRLRETRCKVNHLTTLARRQERGVLSGMTGALSLPGRQRWDLAGAIAADKARAALTRLSPPRVSFAYYLQPPHGFGA